jgi:hypothetical protein
MADGLSSRAGLVYNSKTILLSIVLLVGLPLVFASCTCNGLEAYIPPATSVSATYPNLAGTWQWHATITTARGSNAGQITTQAVREIEITQNGSQLRMTGFLSSNPQAAVTGHMFNKTSQDWGVVLSGTYPEDQGTTSSHYDLVYHGASHQLNGNESWSWTGQQETINGVTAIWATKLR